MEFNLDTTIKELHELGIISVRTYNSLHYAGMDTLGEILNNIETPMDLLNIRNFGRKSYTEVDAILNQMIREHKAVVTPCQAPCDPEVVSPALVSVGQNRRATDAHLCAGPHDDGGADRRAVRDACRLLAAGVFR